MPTLDKTVPNAPIHVVSALSILLADWIVFGLNVATTMHAYWIVDASTALVAGTLVTLAERRLSRNGLQAAVLKGAISALVVALPLPLAGSAIALAALTWSWMSFRSRQG